MAIRYPEKFRVNGDVFQVGHLTVVALEIGSWEHVIVEPTFDDRAPTWQEMCMVKDAFWDAEDTVMQLHPKKSNYVNVFENALHLWRPKYQPIPTPPMEYV